METYNFRIRLVIAIFFVLIAIFLILSVIPKDEVEFLKADKIEIELININTADIEELTELYGVGSATAEKIVEFRRINGSFEKPEDIMLVGGIGKNIYAKNADRIVVYE